VAVILDIPDVRTAEGIRTHWLVAAGLGFEAGKSARWHGARRAQIRKVSGLYGFKSVHLLPFHAAQMDLRPKAELVEAVEGVLGAVKPQTVLLPFSGDAHSDHRVVFEACSSCVKWFRQTSVRRVLAYETLSETGYNLDPAAAAFKPNFYVNIGKFIEKKIRIMKVYRSETGRFPFPRSAEALRALAALRGSECGAVAAEAFMLLKEIR